jgi:hypothetical protein
MGDRLILQQIKHICLDFLKLMPMGSNSFDPRTSAIIKTSCHCHLVRMNSHLQAHGVAFGKGACRVEFIRPGTPCQPFNANTQWLQMNSHLQAHGAAFGKGHSNVKAFATTARSW